MIKTFVGKSPEEIDKLVNQFMEDKGKDMPVRQTIMYDKEGNLNYKYIVFYKGASVVERATEAIHNPKKASGKLGSLWQNENNYSGKLDDKSIKITKESWNDKFEVREMQKGGYMRIGEIEGKKVRIIPNQFKKTEKHPDYVILSAE